MKGEKWENSGELEVARRKARLETPERKGLSKRSKKSTLM